MSKIAFKTIGCRLNQAETGDLAEEFGEAGFSVVSPKETADILVINTCAVTHVASRKSRQALREFKNRNPGSKIVVLGCAKEELAKLPEVDLGIENREKDKALEFIVEKLKIPAYSRQGGICRAGKNQKPVGSRTRVLVKIQEGCDEKCTYCVVPRLRGKPQSISADKILAKVKKHVARGVKEIILTGVHIGAYGDPNYDLVGLVRSILDETKIARLRLSSIEPQHFDPKRLNLLADKRVCPFLHLPVQSGSGNILKLMKRRYQVADVSRIIESIRSRVPQAFISTDIIVGFPGESEADFAETYDFAKKTRFAKIHVFSYSKREGTPAASLPDQIDPQLKQKRSKKLRELSDQLNLEYRRQFVGKKLEVLSETAKLGISCEGVRVAFANPVQPNKIDSVQISGISSTHLLTNN